MKMKAPSKFAMPTLKMAETCTSSARRDAERGLRAVGGEERDLVAGAQAQVLGELGADGDALALSKPSSEPCMILAATPGSRFEIGLANAAREAAGLTERRGGEHLPLDDGQRQR